MNTTIDSPNTAAEVAAKMRALEIAELAALRSDIRALSNVLALLLESVNPQDARFLEQAQELEAQVEHWNGR